MILLPDNKHTKKLEKDNDKKDRRPGLISRRKVALYSMVALAIIFNGCDDFFEPPAGVINTPTAEEAAKLKANMEGIIAREAEESAAKAKEATERAKARANEILREEKDGIHFSQAEPPPGDPILVFKVGNDASAQNGGKPSQFVMEKDHYITQLWTYHWNGGKGAAAGTITVRSQDGKSTYGPWQADLNNGVYWVAKPNVWMPAGSYTVIDSDPGTWATNAESGGQGMSWMMGKPAQ